ncbi:MAG: type IX secretion system protein PorQ [Ignavibacteriales bacterium]|nr:type IX secretion system protein PorQ [Ignavibacteriales bacterium]
MYRMKIFLIATIILIANITQAQNTFEFLRTDYGARAAALAGGYVSTYDDINAMFYNPAAIKELQDIPASFTFFKHLLDINAATLSSSYNFEGIGRFALGIHYINYGTFVRADDFGNKTGEFGAGDIAFVVGYANDLADNFSYGANLKFIYSSIDYRKSTALAVDLGLQYKFPDDKLSFGFSILNLGTQISTYFDTREDLPLDIKIGLSKTLEKLPVTFFFAINKLNEKKEEIIQYLKPFDLGAEIKFSEVIKLRLGYDNEKRKELKVGTTTGLAGLNIGFGITIQKYYLDYALSSLGVIGELHRISLSTSF